jgi:ABC-2 type transport system ATP-binding protein
MSDTSVLQVEDLKKTFRVGFFRKKVHAVRSVSFDINKGEIFGLVGPNGAGKSTTIKLLLGLIQPDEGAIRLFGERADNVELRSRIGYLPENPTLYEHLNAIQLLHFYGRLFGYSKSERDRRAEELLEQVGLSHAMDRSIANYSKGMKQRAGIAQALINDPDLVILDEPQSGLDPIGRREVRDLILDLRRQGKTILFCSHILPDVQAICDRVAVMHQGVVKDVGFLHELIGQETLYYELYVRNWNDSLEERFDDMIDDVVDVGKLTRLQIDGRRDPDVFLDELKAADIVIESLDAHRESLEDVFVRDTSDDTQATASQLPG